LKLLFFLSLLLIATCSAPFLCNAADTPAASRFLGAISKFVKYEKSFERGTKWTEDLSGAKIVQQQKKPKTNAESLAELSNPEAEQKVTYEPASADVLQALKSYYVVPVYEWQNCYSHVGMGDKVGEIILPGGARMHWMLRPGGLAAVVYPDGGIVYLARELQKLRKQ
jgi:hypothetical protein